MLCGIFAGQLFCMPAGYVLHVENRASVPYTAVDEQLKQRILHALVRHRLIPVAQAGSCKLNIMEIDRYYLVEAWPDGKSIENAFSVRLKKTFLHPEGKRVENKSGTMVDSSIQVWGR